MNRFSNEVRWNIKQLLMVLYQKGCLKQWDYYAFLKGIDKGSSFVYLRKYINLLHLIVLKNIGSENCQKIDKHFKNILAILGGYYESN